MDHSSHRKMQGPRNPKDATIWKEGFRGLPAPEARPVAALSRSSHRYLQTDGICLTGRTETHCAVHILGTLACWLYSQVLYC